MEAETPGVLPIIQAVDQELLTTLLKYADRLPRDLITMGKLALSARGKVMALSAEELAGDAVPADIPRWPLYVVLSYQAASPEGQRHTWSNALPAAVAVEIAMAAADVLDEITDADPSPLVATYGPGQALNTANLMLVMSQQVLAWHAREGGGNRALAALGALQDMLVEAAVGQHLDMLYERMGAGEVDLDMSADMTAKKAGALLGGACRMGALSAGAPDEIVQLLDRFGRAMGGVAQLINDIQDVLPSESIGDGDLERKTDLKLKKRTLPIVFTLRDDSPEPNALQRAFLNPDTEEADEEELRRAVLSVGGVQFAQLLIEVHRRNAAQALEELEALRPGARQILSPLFSFDESEQPPSRASSSSG